MSSYQPKTLPPSERETQERIKTDPHWSSHYRFAMNLVSDLKAGVLTTEQVATLLSSHHSGLNRDLTSVVEELLSSAEVYITSTLDPAASKFVDRLGMFHTFVEKVVAARKTKK